MLGRLNRDNTSGSSRDYYRIRGVFCRKRVAWILNSFIFKKDCPHNSKSFVPISPIASHHASNYHKPFLRANPRSYCSSRTSTSSITMNPTNTHFFLILSLCGTRDQLIDGPIYFPGALQEVPQEWVAGPMMQSVILQLPSPILRYELDVKISTSTQFSNMNDKKTIRRDAD